VNTSQVVPIVLSYLAAGDCLPRQQVLMCLVTVTLFGLWAVAGASDDPVSFTASSTGAGFPEEPLFRGYKPRSPTGSEQYPVFIWMVGFSDPFFTPIVQQHTWQMALRGFVAASVNYDNNLPLYRVLVCPLDLCEIGKQNANYVFAGNGSALGQICALPEADCNLGVAVGGHSLGGFTAAASKLFSPFITAQLFYAVAPGGNCIMDNHGASGDCMDQGNLGDIPPSKKRYLIGYDDLTATDQIKADTAQSMARLSGYNCGAEHDCLQVDGSGYYIVESQEFRLSQCAEVSHSLFWDTYDAGENTTYVCDYTKGAHKWSMSANLDWLAAAASSARLPRRSAVPPRPEFNGTEIPCGGCPPLETATMCTTVLPLVRAIVVSVCAIIVLSCAALLRSRRNRHRNQTAGISGSVAEQLLTK
jgi:hypothetical protein